MNPWLELSIEYANQRSYLDDLFRVYPTIPCRRSKMHRLITTGLKDENIMSSLVLREFLYQV